MDESSSAEEPRGCPACGEARADGATVCPACGAAIDPYEGRVVAGKYRLTNLVGQGAMGRVYRAMQIPLGKPFAVKLLMPRLVGDPDSRARFAREAHAAANLNHPNCVSVVDFGQEEDGTAYIVMEFVDGRPLEDVIAREHPLELERVADYTLQILDALAEAHALGILHRDLKPENILVQRLRTHGEILKVVDFGIAQIMDAEAQDRLTRTAMVCGTPEYMSPEQARGLPLDPRSDLYAVGCVLYQMLTGRPPFERSSPVEVLHCHLHEAPVPPSRLLDTPPGPLEGVCLRALAKAPEARFADALAFRRAVREAVLAHAGTRTCAACGAVLGAGARFCAECGHRAPTSVRGPAGRTRRRPTRRSGLNLERIGGESTGDILLRNLPLPLFGREEVMTRCERLLEEDRARVAGLVVAAPEGHGKTRILDEVAARAETMGYRVYYVGADPSGAQVSLWPIRTMVAQLLGLDPETCGTVDLGRAANLLGVAVESLPGLAELFLLEGPAAPLEYRVRKRECIASAVQVLLDALPGQRLLLLFDDLDRYDTASRKVLRRLASGSGPEGGDRPVRVMFATAEADASWLGVESVPLPPLETEAIYTRLVEQGGAFSAIARSVLGDGPTITPGELSLRLRCVAGTGYRAAAVGDGASALLGRADDPDLRTVLSCAAVLGVRCRDEALYTLCDGLGGMTRDRVASALAELHRRGILVVTASGERAFVQAGLADRVLQETGPERRRALHARALALLSWSGRYDAPRRARHAVSAGAPDAVEQLARAAVFAERSFDDAGAVDLAVAAVHLDGEQGRLDDAMRVELAELLGRCKSDAGRLARAVEAIGALSNRVDGSLRPRLAVARGRVRMQRGTYAAAAAELASGLGGLIAAGDMERVLEVYRLLSTAYARGGDWARALRELQEGLDLCTMGEGARAQTPFPLWRYLLAVAEAHRASGDLAGARTWAEDALFQAERRSDDHGALRAHAVLGWLLRETGQVTRARVHVTRALGLARAFGDRMATAELLLERAAVAEREGDREMRRRCLEEAARLAGVLDWRAGFRHARRALERG